MLSIIASTSASVHARRTDARWRCRRPAASCTSGSTSNVAVYLRSPPADGQRDRCAGRRQDSASPGSPLRHSSLRMRSPTTSLRTCSPILLLDDRIRRLARAETLQPRRARQLLEARLHFGGDTLSPGTATSRRRSRPAVAVRDTCIAQILDSKARSRGDGSYVGRTGFP